MCENPAAVACAKIRQTTRSPAPSPTPTWPQHRAHLRSALRPPGPRTAPTWPPHCALSCAHLHRAPRPPGPLAASTTPAKTDTVTQTPGPRHGTMCRIRLHEIFRADALRTLSCCAFVHAEPARIPLLNSCLYMRCGKTLRVQSCLVLPGHVPVLESAQGRTSRAFNT